MPQLHFSVDEATAAKLRAGARARGLSLSRYLAELIEERSPNAWPERYLQQVIGSCAGSGLEEPEDLPIDETTL